MIIVIVCIVIPIFLIYLLRAKQPKCCQKCKRKR